MKVKLSELEPGQAFKDAGRTYVRLQTSGRVDGRWDVLAVCLIGPEPRDYMRIATFGSAEHEVELYEGEE